MADAPQLVLVRWLDSSGLERGGWLEAHEVAENLTADALVQESVGYLVGEGDVAIALAGSRNASVDDADHCSTRFADVLVIPRSAFVGKPLELRPVRAKRRAKARPTAS